MTGVDHLPATYDRDKQAFSKGEPEYGAHFADELERLVNLHGANTIAAVIVEPMAGSTGVLPAPKGYLKRLREITQKHGILLIFDEVITGYGRLGFAFAAERYGVTPDMLTFAKGITNGAAPMGGVLVRDTIHDAFMNGPEHVVELTHGYTYSAHPLACAAGLATLDIYRDEKLFERANKLEPKFADAVMSLKGQPNVVDIRTVGLTAGIDLAPIADAPGKRGFAALNSAFHDNDSDAAHCRRHPGADPALDHHRGPDRRTRRQGRQDHPRGGVICSCCLAPPAGRGSALPLSRRRGTFKTQTRSSSTGTIRSLLVEELQMLAPSSDLLRAGVGLKLNQIKRATRSYLRDRTNQATGTVTSYAIAAGLFAAAGIFLLAACFVGILALFRWVELELRHVPGVRRGWRLAGRDRGDPCRCRGDEAPPEAARVPVARQPAARRAHRQSAPDRRDR